MQRDFVEEFLTSLMVRKKFLRKSGRYDTDCTSLFLNEGCIIISKYSECRPLSCRFKRSFLEKESFVKGFFSTTYVSHSAPLIYEFICFHFPFVYFSKPKCYCPLFFDKNNINSKIYTARILSVKRMFFSSAFYTDKTKDHFLIQSFLF